MSDDRDAQRQVDDSEFLDIAKDPAQARVLRESLQKLAAGSSGDTLKEFAREVLSGRIGLRQATMVSAYSEALIEGGRPFRERWDALSDTERQQLAADGERQLEEKRREIEEERRAREGQRGTGGRPRHDGRGWSLY